MQNVGAGPRNSVCSRLPPPPLQSALSFTRWVGRGVLSRELVLWGCERSGDQTPPPLGKTSCGRRISGRNTITSGPQHFCLPVSAARAGRVPARQRTGWDRPELRRAEAPVLFCLPGAEAPQLGLRESHFQPSAKPIK